MKKLKLSIFIYLTIFLFIKIKTIAGEIVTSESRCNPIIPINLKKVLPKDYDIFYLKKGNINLDQYIDYAIILKKNYSIDDDRPDFILTIYTGTVTNNFQLDTENSNIVRGLISLEWCKLCKGVEDYINIINGQIIITIEEGGSSVAQWDRFYFNYLKSQKTLILDKVITQERHYRYNSNDRIIGVSESKLKTYTKNNFGTITLDKYENYN